MSQIGPLLSPLLVGRDDLLNLADRRIAEAAAGQGQLLLLAGEAGIGKSRLLRAIHRKANAAGLTSMQADLAPHDRQVPLASLRDLARSMPLHPGWEALGADLSGMLTRGELAESDTLANRRLLVLDIAERIADASVEPRMLAFEDLQWSDEMSLEVVWELARLARNRPLLMVGAYRIDEFPVGSMQREWRARLLSQRLAEEARLSALTYDETALVTSLILDTGLPAPREVVDAVYARTDGIPLHIEELLGAMGDDARGDGEAIRRAHVPETIEDAILARYGRLSDDARAVARAGAVVGRCFVPDVLAGVMDRPIADLDAPLEELVANAFLYPFEYMDKGNYDFRHQLLRDALYGTLPAAELRHLHGRAAEFGAALVGATEIHASVHFERAGLRAEAYRAALAGANEASAISSRHEAFELYRRAVANVPDDLAPLELAELYEAYTGAAFAVDNIQAIDDGARKARRYYLDAGRPIEAAGELVALSGMARRDVRPGDERIALLAQAEAELEVLPDTPERNLVLSDVRMSQGIIDLDSGRLDAGGVRFAEASDLRRRSSDPDTRDIDYIAAEIGVMTGQTDAGLESMLRIAREARSERLEALGVTAFRWTAAIAVRVLDYPTAVLAMEEGLRYADEIEQSYCRHVLAATSAHVAWADGRWDDAIPIAEIELVEKGSRRGTLGSRDALGFVAFGRGDVERARMLFEASLAIGRSSGEIELILPAMWGLAETALVAGEPEIAAAQCEAALGLARETGERALLVPFVVTGVRAFLAARRPDAAERWLRDMRDLLSDWHPRAHVALDHGDGLVRMAAGATVSARSSLEAAATGWDAIGRIWESTTARLDLASCLIRGNRHADAVPVLTEVRETAVGLGSKPLIERADELLSLARRRGIADEPWRPLTAREFEVARLVAEGMTNAEIAEALGLSPKTVSAHLEHILAKLGAMRRAEVAAWVTGIRSHAAAGARR